MKDLAVIVVGAGIGGCQASLALAAHGHRVTLLEAVDEFREVGAGIRVSFQITRLAESWGVDFSRIPKCKSPGNRFLDWRGHVLLDVPFLGDETKYGAEYYFIHRADLIKLLVQTVQEKDNINLRMGSKVVGYDFDAPSVTLESGESIKADLIVCADGIKSSVRDEINGEPCEPMDTGDTAYRIVVDSAPLLDDPNTRDLVTEGWAMHWMGPECHAVGYPLRGGELYNIIIDVTHATDLGEPLGLDEWRSGADNAALLERFKDWCEPVRKICGLTGAYLKWKLADFDQLKRWVHPSKKALLLGDRYVTIPVSSRIADSLAATP
jgi:salicylate hydroxylase